MRTIELLDTTLRDGEQSLETTFTVEQKLIIAQQLVILGVDIIEAGFPASSPGDFRAVQTIGREIKGCVVCGMARCVRQDIDLCAEALKKAETPRINLGLAVSSIHMEKKLRLSPDEVIQKAVGAVKYAGKSIKDVQFFAEDALRSDFDFLVCVLEKVIEAGASVVTISDTVGIAVPWQMSELVTKLKARVKGMDKAKLSIHCHNDLGLATANSLMGIMAGADQIEASINGIGERAGNASIEEIVMALYLQKKNSGIETHVNTREIFATSRLVSEITEVPISRYKAIVGDNMFQHASGIHQDGMIKDKQTYEPFSSEIIGAAASKIILNARSGRHALQHRLAELGYQFPKTDFELIYRDFIRLADENNIVLDQELHALVLAQCINL